MTNYTYKIKLNVTLVQHKPYISWVEMLLLQGLNPGENVEVEVLSTDLTENTGSL